MKNILLSFLLLVISTVGFCTKWTIINSGRTFSPATITINFGDSVVFSISTSHNAVEVSQATWTANGTAALPGFSLPFGGGLVTPDKLTAGTHYYVCTPHASSGMKASIIVQNKTTGIAENQLKENITVYPNPTNGKFQITYGDLNFSKNYSLEIYNVNGERMYNSVITNPKSDIDLSNQSKGVYFMKFHDGQAVLTKKIVIQ
jgi:plastocyanin